MNYTENRSITCQSGPIRLEINQVKSYSSERLDANNLDSLRENNQSDVMTMNQTIEEYIIVMDVKVSNCSNRTIFIYPDQMILTTQTGKRIIADPFRSDIVGGKFRAYYYKEGKIIF